MQEEEEEIGNFEVDGLERLVGRKESSRRPQS